MTIPPSAATPFDSTYGAQAATQLAGFWRRFVAYLLDSLIVGVVGAVVEAIVAAILHATGNATVRVGLVDVVLGLLYFGYMWSQGGQTVGYQVLGLRLVRADGRPVSFALAALRYLAIYLSFLLCALPAVISSLMIGLGQRKQGIHDLMAGTLVVRA